MCLLPLYESPKWMACISQNSHFTTWLSYFMRSTFGSPLSRSVCPWQLSHSSSAHPVFLLSRQDTSGFTYCLPNVGMSPFLPWIFLSPLFCLGRYLPYIFIPTGLRRGQLSGPHILLMSSMIKISCPHPLPCSRTSTHQLLAPPLYCVHCERSCHFS